jgi:hypothetical protein
MITTLGIVRLAAMAHQAAPAVRLSPGWRTAVQIALHLVPVAGIAFLWFLGVLRNRLGQREDKFFATVFLGSGLLFVGTMFGAAAVLGSLLEDPGAGSAVWPDSGTRYFALRLSIVLLNIVGVKMAAVFMFSTSTIALRTAFLPRWVAFSGFACGLVLLLVITTWAWIEMLFPLWVLLVSLTVLAGEILGHKNKR